MYFVNRNGTILYKLHCNNNKSQEPHTETYNLIIKGSSRLLKRSLPVCSIVSRQNHALNNYLFSWALG